MAKMKIVFLCFGLLYIVACKNEGVSEAEAEPVLIEESKPFDKIAYLEQFNTEDIIYENTETYIEITNSKDVIEYSRTRHSDLAHQWSIRRKDSVFTSVVNNIVIITKLQFLHGEFPIYLPYLEVIENDIYLKSPKLYPGTIQIFQNDTIIEDNGIDGISGWELIYKIPLSKLENTEHLYFKGQEIKFR